MATPAAPDIKTALENAINLTEVVVEMTASVPPNIQASTDYAEIQTFLRSFQGDVNGQLRQVWEDLQRVRIGVEHLLAAPPTVSVPVPRPAASAIPTALAHRMGPMPSAGAGSSKTASSDAPTVHTTRRGDPLQPDEELARQIFADNAFDINCRPETALERAKKFMDLIDLQHYGVAR